MECLHGKAASNSTTDKGSFWFCGQKPSCGFLCTEEDGYLFQTALTAWRATGLTQPICESHRKPAKFRVVKDMLKKSYGRLRVQVGRILAPYGCGQTRKKSRNRIAITTNRVP